MHFPSLKIFWGALLLIVAATLYIPAVVAKELAADRAWIDKCVADRKSNATKIVALRKYCVCMQGVVENNQPFGVSELERTYPPAHLMCWKGRDVK